MFLLCKELYHSISRYLILKIKNSFRRRDYKLWLDNRWKDVQDKWAVKRDCIIDSAEAVLGKAKKYKLERVLLSSIHLLKRNK